MGTEVSESSEFWYTKEKHTQEISVYKEHCVLKEKCKAKWN